MPRETYWHCIANQSTDIKVAGKTCKAFYCRECGHTISVQEYHAELSAPRPRLGGQR